jgi:amino acid adenylation domain-containing protein
METEPDVGVALSPTADGGMEIAWRYDAALFDAATAERMLASYRRLLLAAADAPAMRVSRLPLLDAAGRALVVEEWNRTDAPFPAERCIHQLVEAQVARTPNRVAVVHEREELTYRELNARANRLAHHLRGLGIGPERRVGICLGRGPELVVAMLAVLKSGGAYVPLDPAYPAERLEFTLDDAAVAALVTEDGLRGLVSLPPGVPVVRVDADAAAIAAACADDPESGVAPRNLAYLIYTSGSTGRPKGVAIEHRSAVAMLAWSHTVWSPQELAGTLAATSICFDISVWETFAPLSVGGCAIVVENALALARTAARDRVTLLNTVPSAGAALLREGAIPPGVGTVNLAGELLKPELVDAMYATGTVRRVYDLYGPSEDTTYSTCALRLPGAPPTLGRMAANSRAYVVDAALEPVPPGVAGELYIAGEGVTRGYLGRPGLTASRYLPDPFSRVPGARMYRTGDRIRWQGDGTLQFLGRIDHQVKVRGYRIELGEVEAALRRHPRVADCVAVAAEDERGEKRLVAYVVGGADADELRDELRRTLPAFMVPAAFVAMDALPQTPNGKLDRNALPALHWEGGDDDFVAPRTGAEIALAGIWREVLGIGRVSVRDSFFELGGHSLLAIRAASRISEAFGAEVGLEALFAHSTIEALALHLPHLRVVGDAAEGDGAGGDGAGDAEASPHRLLAVLDDLSEEELDRILGLQT